jgi:hypothetical protein
MQFSTNTEEAEIIQATTGALKPEAITLALGGLLSFHLSSWPTMTSALEWLEYVRSHFIHPYCNIPHNRDPHSYVLVAIELHLQGQNYGYRRAPMRVTVMSNVATWINEVASCVLNYFASSLYHRALAVSNCNTYVG